VSKLVPKSHALRNLESRLQAGTSLYFAGAVTIALLHRVILGFLPVDDAFISFRFAYNLASHGELTCNLGDPVFGSTALLYTLLLAVLGAVGIPIPIASWAVTLLADVCNSVIFVYLGWRFYTARLGFVAACLYLVHPVIALNSISGMETSIYVSALLLFALAIAQHRFAAATLIFSLMPWIRIDGLFCGFVLALFWFRDGCPRVDGRATLAAAAIIGAYLVFTWATFGAVLPESALAKFHRESSSLLGSIAVGASFPAAFLGLSFLWHWFISPLALLFPCLVFKVASVRSANRLEQTFLLLAATFALMYGIPGRLLTLKTTWYYVPFIALLIIPSLSGAVQLLRNPQWLARHWFLILLSGTGMLLLLSGGFEAALGSLLHRILGYHPELYTADGIPIEVIVITNLQILGAAFLLMAALIYFRQRSFAVPVIVAIFGLALYPIALDAERQSGKYARREASYLALGDWINRYVEQGEFIGAREIGALGWAAPNQVMYDEWGLVTKGARNIRRSQWVAQYRPALVVGTSLNIDRARPREMGNYFVIDTQHLRLWIREDYRQAWKLHPPPLS
jgi:hypothetical protein